MSKSTTRWFLFVVSLLCLPAFLINLGYIPFIEDEAIRAIVAFEMLHSDNYIVPTINGDPYYYKPPLYNWILALSYTLFGTVNEWTSRFPTVLFAFGLAVYIYRVVRRLTSNAEMALASALTFLTCGRVLFYDSFLGLIDIAFSWVVFAMLVSLYDLHTKPKRLLLIYFLTALAYMLKGFPAFIFLCCGMFVYVMFFKELKQLWTRWHIAGIVCLAAILGTYYGLYNYYHIAVNTFTPLLEQSTIRTFLHIGIGEVLLHIATFPFENIYHFLPWSILTLMAMVAIKTKSYRQPTVANFMGLMFAANILVYWVSPGYYPRYIIMLVPLYFIYFLSLYFQHRQSGAAKAVDVLLKVLFGLVLVACLVSPMVPRLGGSLIANVLAFGVVVVIGVLAYLHYKGGFPLWAAMVVLLLCIRIQYDFSVLPTKNISNGASASRVEAKRIAREYQPLFLYRNARMDKTSSFYLATTQGHPLSRSEVIEGGNYYLVDTMKTKLPISNTIVIDSLPIVERGRKVYVVRAN